MPTIASCQAVMPSECRYVCATAARGVVLVGVLRRDGPTSAIAPSWSVPDGSPSAVRSIRPSPGSGVSRVMPASSSARELTQAPCPSRLVKNAGRSGTIASRTSFVGVPPGNTSMYQPPPRIHGASGSAAA